MSTSWNVAAGVAAMGVMPKPSFSTNPQQEPPLPDPETLLASINQIAPEGIVQTRVSGSEADALANIILTQANAQYTMLAGGAPLSEFNEIYLSQDVYRAIRKNIVARTDGVDADGLSYTNYALETQIEGVWIGEGTATVIWTQRIGLSFTGEDDPVVPSTFYEIRPHFTSLRWNDSAWRITVDDADFAYRAKPIFSVFNDLDVTPFDGSIKPTSISRSDDDDDDDGDDDGAGEDSRLSFESETFAPATTTLFAKGTYDRVAAATYATVNGDKRDGSGEGRTGYYDFGQNCTNFISQCMKTGGWQYVNGDRRSNSAWWYSVPYSSYTWAAAQNFYWFVQNSKRGERISNVYDMEIGDVLQWDFEGDGILDHTQICHARSTVSGRHYMAQHTSSYAWKPLGDVLAGYKDSPAKAYAWHMKDSY
jgi:hypothetical protein